MNPLLLQQSLQTAGMIVSLGLSAVVIARLALTRAGRRRARGGGAALDIREE